MVYEMVVLMDEKLADLKVEKKADRLENQTEKTTVELRVLMTAE